MAEDSDHKISGSETAETLFSQDDFHPNEISRQVSEAPQLKAGDVLFGAYEIEGKLGEGGMGAVYRARHLSLGALRAIKMMSANLISDPDAVMRFHREAKALLDVHHPAVVRCHDLLRDEHGRVFLIMEMIEGIPLSRRMAEKPLSEDELRDLGKRIGEGLEAAHARGVIHRDISPDNIVLPQGRADLAKLVDFGIAKVLVAGEETITAGFKGKLAFASPEQLGYWDGEIGPASDFFSLGLLLCGAAVGKRIPMGKSLATAVDARREPIAIPSEVPERLRADIEKLLVLDPHKRATSVANIFVDPARSTPPRASRRPTLGIAAGLLVCLAVAAYFFISPGDMRTGASKPDAAELDSGRTQPVGAPGAVSGIGQYQQEFEDLRRELIEARRESPAIFPVLSINPNPVENLQAYSVEIKANCECFPLVFFIDANEDIIELLFPNPLEEPRQVHKNEIFRIPSSQTLYSFEAISGTGIDRLKLILLPEAPNFPPEFANARISPKSPEELEILLESSDGGFWSVSPEAPERLDELAALLERLETREWVSSETVLHVIR